MWYILGNNLTSYGRVGLDLAGHSRLAPHCYLVHMRHSVCGFDQLKYAGFSTHRHAGRLTGYSGDPKLCTQEVNQSTKPNKSTVTLAKFKVQSLSYYLRLAYAAEATGPLAYCSFLPTTHAACSCQLLVGIDTVPKSLALDLESK